MFRRGTLLAQSKNEFYLRRLHSLLGVIPIGAFLIVHLMVNHQATQGAEAFNRASGFMESLPFLIVMEFILIYIPLLYHGLFGLHIAFTAKENIGHYSLFRNWMFFFQRVSGILAFVLLQCTYGKHVCKSFYGKSVDYNLMHETLQHPLWAIFYIICVIAVVFHFANGLWSFCVTWGFYNLKITTCFYLDFTHSILVISYIGVAAVIAFI